jgi:hypothetical protein
MKINRVQRNIIVNFFLQIVGMISGIVLPHFIISIYGSTLNGLIGSIGQFLFYAGLVEAGVGSAAMIALYTPLLNHDYKSMSGILSAVSNKYRISGIVYTIIIIGIALIYPLMIRGQVNYIFTFFMTVILAANGMIDYFLIGRYKVLLMADQKYYIINFVKIFATCALTIGSVFLLKCRVSLLIVKGIGSFLHLIEALVIKKYVHVKYPNIIFNEKSELKFKQQKSVMVQQICMVITYNTDLIVLTIMLPANSLQEISVYSVYAMILSFAKNFMSVLYVGISAAFGNIYAHKDLQKLNRKFRQYELIFDIFLFLMYSCVVALILPFVKCYTGNITDVNYVRMDLAILFSLNGIVAQIKDSHSTLIHEGCGKYKETEKYAVYEAVSNITISVILAAKSGVAGVLTGTLISHLFMDYGVIKCTCREILPEMGKITKKRIIRNGTLFVILSLFEIRRTGEICTWAGWITSAIGITVFNGAIILCINYLFEKEEIREVFYSLRK